MPQAARARAPRGRPRRRQIEATTEEHRRLLQAFVQAAVVGDIAGLVALLADDAVLVSDGGPNGRVVSGTRNLAHPLSGAARVAAFIAHTSKIGAQVFEIEEQVLNGKPAIVFRRDGVPSAALTLFVADGKIQSVYFHGDVARLGHVAITPRLWESKP